VYVETTVIRYLVGRIVNDPIIAGRQTATRLWWPTAQEKYRLLVSRLVADECSAGDATAAAERLGIVNCLEYLDASEEAARLAEEFIARNAIPPTEPRNASHISLATVNGIQYLATWNLKHIANPVARAAIEFICREAGYQPPLICTPEELAEI